MSTVPYVLKVWDGFTDDEFFQFCQLNRDLNFERDKDGNIIIMPPTGSITGGFNADLNLEIGIWNRKKREGKVFDSSTGFTLPNGAVRSPDVSWVLLEKWNELTVEEKTKFAPICPDFVLELKSENDRIKDLHLKMQEYIENGCRLGWLIDRSTETVFIYQPNVEMQTVKGFDRKLNGGAVLVDFELDLNILK